MDQLSMPLPTPVAAQARAEFYLCLARAFAVPTAPDLFAAMRDALAADLRAIAGDAGYLDAAATETVNAALTAYESAIAAIPDQPALLKLYSRLFLVPGDAHPSLDTGIYLDGAPEGRSVGAMASWYERCGLAPTLAPNLLATSAPSARPDHLSVQLEFVAWLFGTADAAPSTDPPSTDPPGPDPGTSDTPAGGPPPGGEPSITAAAFLRAFVGRWIRPFRADLAAAETRFHLPANPYAALARLLDAAVCADLADADRALAAMPAATTTSPPAIDPEIARLRSEYAGRRLTEEDLAIIRARLAADGLPSDHVAIPVDERDRVMGLATMTPPQPPAHRMGTAS